MMYSVLTVAHGSVAKSLIETSQMILGETQEYNIDFYTIDRVNESQTVLEDLILLMRDLGRESQGNLLVLTDIYGGSPANMISEAMFILRDELNVSTFCGVNLPMTLEAVSKQKQYSLDDITEKILTIGHDSITQISYEMD